MAHYNTILHELLKLIPRHHFDNRVRELQGDRYVKKFSTWNQLTVLLYAQAGGKTSLRDIQNALASQVNHLYHLGLPDHIAKSTLADANENRDYRIYEDLFNRLKERCQAMAPRHKFKFPNPMFILDSTVVDLSVRALPWARHSKRRGALRMHFGVDAAGEIPVFLNVTTSKTGDLPGVRNDWPIIPDSINCFDRGYVDTKWFRRIHDGGAFFVTRHKEPLVYLDAGQHEVPENSGVTRDRIVEFSLPSSHKKFPYKLRLISYKAPVRAHGGRIFRFLTNNFELDAQTIADIYKARWEIEAFFKFIKQNLRIKSFLGTSRNAVLSQIWVAMCYYLLLSYIKFQSKYAHSLFYLHRIVKETLLDRLTLIDLLGLNQRRIIRVRDPDPQLTLAL